VLARRVRGGPSPASPIPSTCPGRRAGPSIFRKTREVYVSVVGNATDSRYNEIVGWLDTNASLKSEDQSSFCPVTSDTAVYKPVPPAT